MFLALENQINVAVSVAVANFQPPLFPNVTLTFTNHASKAGKEENIFFVAAQS